MFVSFQSPETTDVLKNHFADRAGNLLTKLPLLTINFNIELM